MKDKDYDFNVCIKCQEIRDILCIEDCKYLKEKEAKENEKM